MGLHSEHQFVIIDTRDPECGAVDNNVYANCLQATRIAEKWGGNYTVAAISAVAGHYVIELEMDGHCWTEYAVSPEDAQRLLSLPLDGDSIADWFGVRRVYARDARLYVYEPDGVTWTTSLQVTPDADEAADEEWRQEWRREMAMEAGMLHGCQGYNDFMGY